MQALIFDLDGTLIDTVYAHIFSWQKTFTEAGLTIDGWKIHRFIGMSGGLFTRAVGRELNREFTVQEAEMLLKRHGEIFLDILPERKPLPGAVELIECLRLNKIPFGIATSGIHPEIDASLEALGLGDETVVIQRSDVSRAKPEPDLFLACQRKLGIPQNNCYVVGDAVWDMLAARRANILSIGLLSGGVSEGELSSAGAFRVYNGPLELLHSLDELGVLP
jgi:HAD superfamily hydrolase (TIGR01549 family)